MSRRREPLSVIGSGGLGDIGLHIVSLKLHSIVDLLADLLGEGQLDSGAGRGGDNSDALLDNSDALLDLGNGDAGLRDDILAGDDGQVDGLVDAHLLGLGVGHSDGGLDGGDDGDVVASLLGDLLAVVVAVAVVAVSGGGLAHGHHLDIALLVEGDLDSLGGGLLGLLLVMVGADLVGDHLDALSAHGAGDGVALLDILDGLAAQLDGIADGLKGGGADLGSLDNIEHGTVVLRVFVPVVDLVVVCWGWLVVRWLGVVVWRRLGCIASVGRGGRVIASVGGGRRVVGVRTKSQGGQGQQGNKLGRFSIIKNKSRICEIGCCRHLSE